MNATIPFNKPYITGKEAIYLDEVLKNRKLSGDGLFTTRCHEFFQTRYHFRKCLLTTSCTDALEMSALLLSINPGDEVILPSYTFVSTANAFALRGARLIFIDSRCDHPGMDEAAVEELITDRTRAIVPVHYAGVACDMDALHRLAHNRGIWIVEDAAQAVDSFYISSSGKRSALGGIGHCGAFSFHETKNVVCGEGGMLVVNEPQFFQRAEIIREKGTNRSAFFRGEVNKYGWMDIGSSFLPSELVAAFLAAQLEHLEQIQSRRLSIWHKYWDLLSAPALAGRLRLPAIPKYATNNAHMFYIVLPSLVDRNRVIAALKAHGVMAIFHYLSLHCSDYFKPYHDGRVLKHADRYTDTLLRLPLFYELAEAEIEMICRIIRETLAS